MAWLSLAILCSLSWSAHAATYYIDWNSGDDTNNGTSTNSPWKRHPAMNGWLGGPFTAQPGDRFILKGGVTWPNEACSFYITDNGTEANRIYIGIDTNWYSGDQFITWTNGNGVKLQVFNYPTIDAQGVDISDARSFAGSTTTRNNVVIVAGDYVTLEGLKIMGVLINDNPAGGSNNPDSGTDHTLRVHACADFQGIGLYLCDWVVETTLGGDVGGAIASGGATASLINSRIKGPENIDPQWITAADGRDYGNAIQHFSVVQGCDISRVGQGVWNCRTIEGNIIHTMGRYTDARAHENGIWAQATTLIRNNVMRNINGGVGIYLLPGWGGRAPHKQHVYNNVFWNTPQINLTPQSSPDETNEIWFFNNVVKQGAYCIQVGTTKAGAAFGTLVIQNNVFVSDGGNDPSSLVRILNSDSLGSQYTNSHNVYMSTAEATALGINEANLWEPQDEVTVLNGGGVNFSEITDTDKNGMPRPQAGAWDIGAYQWSGETAGFPPAYPSGLVAESISDSQIALSWTDNATNEAGFHIERSLSSVTGFVWVHTAAANVTSFTDIGLSAGISYHYRVRAYNASGNSAYSATASATTTVAYSDTPRSPSNLQLEFSIP